MSRAAFIENVARKGNMNKAEAKLTVDLVFGEIEAGLTKSKKESRYTISNFTVNRRKARKDRNPRTGEQIRIKASKLLRFRPSAALKSDAQDGRRDDRQAAALPRVDGASGLTIEKAGGRYDPRPLCRALYRRNFLT